LGFALALKALLVLCAVGYCLAGSGWAAYDGGYEYAVWRDIVGRSYMLAGSTTVVMGKKTIDDDCKTKTKKDEWAQ
jgi:hypothetical protein